VLLHLDIIKVFYLPTDAQVNFLKNNFKIYIKIDIKKTAPTVFGAITLSVLLAVTQSCLLGLDSFHIHTVHLDVISLLFTNRCTSELSYKQF
jgi:hypothetical protein